MAAHNGENEETDMVMDGIAKCAYNSTTRNRPGGKYFRFPGEEREDGLKGHTNVAKVYGFDGVSFSGLITGLERTKVSVHLLDLVVNVCDEGKNRNHKDGPKGMVADGCVPDVEFTYIDEEAVNAATSGVSSYASAITDEEDSRATAAAWHEQTGKEMAAALGKIAINAKKALDISGVDLVPSVRRALFSAEGKLLWNSGRVGEEYGVVISQQGAELVATFSGLKRVSHAVAKSMFTTGRVNDVVVDIKAGTVSVLLHFPKASGSKRRRDLVEADKESGSDDDDLDTGRSKKKSKSLLVRLADALLPAP